MPPAFIIMQIGNSELETVCREVFVPALIACGFDPKRVDKHNEGRLLKSEIVEFIETSDIIIADLTNERPNCYLEVGYAMGLDKFRNLILTAREDHNQDNTNYEKGGPKVHFDLSGYDILFWNPKDLKGFREELEKRIRRRMATLVSSTSQPSDPWDHEWISKHQAVAASGLKKTGKPGFMEVQMALRNSKLNVSQGDLLQVADQSQIHTFGWPLAPVAKNIAEYMPKPRTDGIVADIFIKEDGGYDYWAIRKDGTFYLLKSLFEDGRIPQRIFFNTRIVQITEMLLYAVRLYTGLKVPVDTRVIIRIRHGGLKGRILAAVGNRDLHWERICDEDEVSTEIETTLEGIESNLVNLVQKFTEPLFIIFDYFELSKGVLEDIINNFVAGKVT
ncbi:MAG: hypothetical protein A2142_00950 [candidate division Zixibacteria bacterium RBG_16_48_11]|nr:MAG: hypothetical protein A2142_00950 [candidate division Zixibacteria bacterium RBG_16_48_11]